MRGDEKLADAMRVLLGAHVRKLDKRLRKARAGTVGGVHKSRTELRRIRTEIDTMGHTAFGWSVMALLAERLRETERALAKTRDDDVLLADLDAHLRGASRGDSRDLADVRARLVKRRRRAAKSARTALDRRAREALEGALRDAARPRNVVALQPKNPARAAPELVRHFTHREVWRRYDALLAYDARLPADVATLHKLRSALRELRFTLEAFQEALPALAPIARALHGLQDEMGELHDHQVAIDRLELWRREGKVAASRGLERYLETRAAARDELRSRSEPRWLSVLGEDFRLRLASALEPHARVPSLVSAA
jgi:CHAD domain-containing protein